ncbi:NERD domain-containing protein [Vibrio splendidus]|uniref:NERD domain-containing protein n=1 Tax=Vibrio splendidus TaxID=29497 RepID=UPI000D3BD1D4|nr:NERD domain-containing protein [Vibrio splendidus]PTP26702.1 hypothetical protein CWN92_21065 [Vibrio splendidus]
MKEDILEQLVDEYLQHKGYFTQHNIKFRPRKDHPDFITNQDSNHSDIDVLAINPLLNGPNRILAVSCKSWQKGFNPQEKITQITENKTVSGREAWKGFRELIVPKWNEAFKKAVFDMTGSTEFTYVTAVTRLKGDKAVWEEHPLFIQSMGSKVEILTFSNILDELYPGLDTTMASSEVGRLLQLIKASNWSPNT